VKNKPEYTFDEENHVHRIGGYVVPGVTTVLNDLIPCWAAGEWYLERGKAVHACAAMIALKKEFEYDPQIEGQVHALRQFFEDHAPEVYGVEQPVFSLKYRYAGIADLFCTLAFDFVLIDFKASFSEALPFQLAAYSMAYQEMTGKAYKLGMGVEIHPDGTYALSALYDLKRYKQEWLSLLTTYRIRRRCKVKEETEA